MALVRSTKPNHHVAACRCLQREGQEERHEADRAPYDRHRRQAEHHLGHIEGQAERSRSRATSMRRGAAGDWPAARSSGGRATGGPGAGVTSGGRDMGCGPGTPAGRCLARPRLCGSRTAATPPSMNTTKASRSTQGAPSCRKPDRHRRGDEARRGRPRRRASRSRSRGRRRSRSSRARGSLGDEVELGEHEDAEGFGEQEQAL